MIAEFLQRAKLSVSLPLPWVLARVLRRLGSDNMWVRKLDFKFHPGAARPMKSIGILFDALQRGGVSTDIFLQAIHGRNFMEIGCGPYLGFAPFVVGGGGYYIGVDPCLDLQLLRHGKVCTNYFNAALQAAKYFMTQTPECHHLLPGFTDDTSKIFERSRLFKCGISDLKEIQEKVDICVSISCLEHIPDFPVAAKNLSALSHSGTIHIHLVNFSNHLSKKTPFHKLYEEPYEKFGQRWSHSINGLRLRDIEREFRLAGLPLRALPLDVRPDALPDRIDATWLARYDVDELAVRTALLIGQPQRNSPE
jgi:hypothetical protein